MKKGKRRKENTETKKIDKKIVICGNEEIAENGIIVKKSQCRSWWIWKIA